LGVEPSLSNYQLSLKAYPETEALNLTFEDLVINEKFDLIIGIMSFTHIKNMDFALSKIKELMSKKGELAILALLNHIHPLCKLVLVNSYIQCRILYF